MDTSFWIRSNPKITVEHTTKKYFGKYLYKIVVYCPAGRLVDSKESMDVALLHRREISKHINQSGWWGVRQNKDLDHANIEFLSILRGIRQDRTLGVKLRVEEPRIQIYAANEEDLIKLVSTYFQPFKTCIESVAGPEDSVAEDFLNSGAIIRKSDNGYTHKVLIRDGRYTAETRETVLQYLDSLGPEIAQLPLSGYGMLNKNSSYIWNLYFYTNDPSVTTFLNLIHPGLVLNIHPLVVLSHK